MSLVTNLLNLLHPKVKASVSAGALVTVLVALLAAFGINLPVEVVSAVTVLVSATAGYLKSSHIVPAASQDPTPDEATA